MHGEGLQILSGERQKQLQECIIAAETACTLVDEDTAQIREKVLEQNAWITKKGSVMSRSTHPV